MKDRLVKGRHVRGVLELLASQGRLETLPELAPPGADLIRKPVHNTTWYQLGAFEDLLQSVHRYVFDGSEAAGQKMGRLLAEKYFETQAPPPQAQSDPLKVGQQLSRYWRSHFNFGTVSCQPQRGDATGIRLQVAGYPDMSACHGHLLMGWALEALECTLKQKSQLVLEERPWMHNSVLTFTLSPKD